MSLRDALLAKGVVSKKDADRVSRELREERKAEQGNRARKSHEERAAAEAAKAEQEARRLALIEARAAEAAVREAREHALRVKQIVLSNRLAGRGPVPFHYRVGDTPRVGRLMVHEAVARDLRNGEAAIAGFRTADGGWEHHVVARRAAEKLSVVEPLSLAHWVSDARHLSDPSEALLQRAWDTSLRPHRVREPYGGNSAT